MTHPGGSVILDAGELDAILWAIREAPTIERPHPAVIEKLIRALDREDPESAEAWRDRLDVA
jgi:hypothetical protein